MFEAISSLDIQILLFIQNFIRNDILDSIMLIFTYLGEAGTVWIIISICLLFTKKHRKVGLVTLLCMLICYIANDLVLKNIFIRPRPFVTEPAIDVLSKLPSSLSFPSGHACSSFAAAYAIAHGCGKKAGWVYVLSTVIALSRPYVGVHYLSDILVGAAVGTLLCAIIYPILSKAYDKTVNKKSAS